MRLVRRYTWVTLLILSLAPSPHQAEVAAIGPAAWYDSNDYIGCTAAGLYITDKVAFEAAYSVCLGFCTFVGCLPGELYCHPCIKDCWQAYAGAMRALEIPCLMAAESSGQIELPDPWSSYFFATWNQFSANRAGTPSKPMYYLKNLELTPNGGAFGNAPYVAYFEPGTYQYRASDAYFSNLNKFTLPATLVNNKPEDGPVRIEKLP